MTEHLQEGFTASRVPSGRIFLIAPLRRAWCRNGAYGAHTCASRSGLIAYNWRPEGDAMVFLGLAGEELWRVAVERPPRVACNSDLVYASTQIGGEAVLVAVGQGDGGVRQSRSWPFDLMALLTERSCALGVSAKRTSPDKNWTNHVVLQHLSEPEPRWSLRTQGAPWLELACDSRRAFLCGGESLVAIGLDRGDEVWSRDLTPVGGPMAGFWQPMVAERKVVILTHDGTTAFDAETGHIVWCYTRQHGHRMIYDGRVYMIDQAYYTILDLQDGRELLRVRMLDQLRQKWGLDDVGISTGLLVSETHAFFGDGAGRLFAVERDTGEPVWFDRPKGTRGYLGVIPVVAGNRLYITTFSMDPKRPGQLYCYEGAGLGA